MFIEKRPQGKSIKYYLSHTYREGGKVKKITRYLGRDLKEKELNELKKNAEKIIKEELEKMGTEVFNFTLTKNDIERLNSINRKIKVSHLDENGWRRFDEDFVYNTNAIEGSEVLPRDVKDILDEKKPALEPDEKEALGVKKAVEYIRSTGEKLSLDLIKKLHELCFRDTKPFAGKFRDVDVVIRGPKGNIIHVGIPPEKVEAELVDMIDWYEKNKNKFQPLVLAAIIHNQFEYIHPFQDGNGRVGRLLLNYILIKNNYPPINILLEDRKEYYRCLDEYSSNNNIKATLNFLVSQYNKYQ